MCCQQPAQLPAKLQQQIILLSSYAIKISYSVGVWAIAEWFAALPEKIPAEFDMPNKPVWEYMDMLLDAGEPKRAKKDAACVAPNGPHMTAYFDIDCRQKKGAGGFMIYGFER